MSSKIHVTSLSNPLKAIQLLMDTFKDRITGKNSAVIQIDLLYPQAYPITTNPEVLKNVIGILLEFGIKRITVIGGSTYTISPLAVWNSMGYREYITSQYSEVEFIPINYSTEMIEKEVNFRFIHLPKVVIESELFISIINPKTSLFSDLSLCVESSQYLLSHDYQEVASEKQKSDYCENDGYLQSYQQDLLDTHFCRPPDLTLYDLSAILTRAGPLLYTDSVFQFSDMLVCSENSVIGDLLILKLCGKDPSDNSMIEAIKNYDYSLVSQETRDSFEVIFTSEETNGDILDQDISEILVEEKEEEKKPKHRIWKRKEGYNDAKIPYITDFAPFIDLYDIFPQKVELCKGIMCSGCKKAATEFLLFLKTVTIKDQETIPNFSLLLGKNPIEPTHEYCIVFGDHAIETTKERKFRDKIISKSLRTDNEIDIERAKLKIKLQKKLVEMESHREFIKQEIPEGKRREYAIKRLDRKLKQTKRFNDYRLRFNDFRLRIAQHRNEKFREHPKTQPNTKILEIPGCPPKFILHIYELIKLFGKRWVPGLLLKRKFLKSFTIGPSDDNTLDKKEKEAGAQS